MTIYLKQSTASQEVPVGPFLDDTDGKTAETGLTIANTDIKLWKNGATTLANKNSGGATHISGGIYYAVLDATDTNTLGPMVIFVSVSGALPVRLECCVLAANVYDSLIGGGDLLQVDTQQFGNAAGTFSSGRPEVNASHWGGTAIASALVRGNLIQISGSNVDTTAAQLGVNVVQAGATAWNSGAIKDTSFAAGALTAAKFASGALDAVWSTATRLLTAGTNIVLAKGTGITGFNDLDAAGVRTAVGLASANLDTQIGDLPTNAELATALAGADDAVLSALSSVQSHGDTYWATATGFSTLTEADVRDALGLASADLDTQLGAISTVTGKLDDTLEDDGGTYRFTANALEEAPSGGGGGPTAEEIADAVWDETIADHDTVGSTGAALAAAGGSGDPWATALPGSYGAGTAGKIMGDALDAAISTRLASASYTAPDNTGIGAIKAKTDNLPTDPADQSLVMAGISAVYDRLGAPVGASIAADIADLPSAAAVAAAVLSVTYEGSDTVQDFLRLASAALYGKAAGMETTSVTFRNPADTKTRITATVDEYGNRSSVTTDAA